MKICSRCTEDTERLWHAFSKETGHVPHICGICYQEITGEEPSAYTGPMEWDSGLHGRVPDHYSYEEHEDAEGKIVRVHVRTNLV